MGFGNYYGTLGQIVMKFQRGQGKGNREMMENIATVERGISCCEPKFVNKFWDLTNDILSIIARMGHHNGGKMDLTVKGG